MSEMAARQLTNIQFPTSAVILDRKHRFETSFEPIKKCFLNARDVFEIIDSFFHFSFFRPNSSCMDNFFFQKLYRYEIQNVSASLKIFER